jgi:hypothetical protein
MTGYFTTTINMIRSWPSSCAESGCLCPAAVRIALPAPVAPVPASVPQTVKISVGHHIIQGIQLRKKKLTSCFQKATIVFHVK